MEAAMIRREQRNRLLVIAQDLRADSAEFTQVITFAERPEAVNVDRLCQIYDSMAASVESMRKTLSEVVDI
jgi:hypothetical protein